MKYKQLLIFLFLCLGQVFYAQLSRKHYIPPLTSGDNFGEQYIYISTPSTNGVNFTIKPISNSIPSSYQGIVSNTNPREIAVLDNFGNPNSTNSHLFVPFLNTGNILRDKGFIVTADEPIFVSVRVRSQDGFKVHAGALVSKGEAGLGTRFRIGGFKREITPTPSHVNFASIMATENSTQVTISELPSGIILSNGATLPIVLNLNEGDSYIIAVRGHWASDNIGDFTTPPSICTSNCPDPRNLIGGLITSNKPIVVNSGSAQGSFGRGSGQDYGFDQIVGVDKIGDEYILMRGATSGLGNSDAWENVLVIADEPNTEITVNGSTIPIIITNAGEHIVIEGDKFTSDNYMHIKSNKNIFVYQGVGGIDGSGGLNVANSGLFFVPPLSCESIYDVDNIPFLDTIGGDSFNQNVGVTIVTTDGANITIKGNPINSIPAVNRVGPINTGVPSKSDPTRNYITYKISNQSGDISVKSEGSELYCSYFNASGFATTSAFYSGFPIPPVIEFDVSSTGCISSTATATLRATRADTFDSYEWEFLDEGDINDPNDDLWDPILYSANSPILNPDKVGQYRLVGTTCSGDRYISPIIPVSQCASDIDMDDVIDNLDVDLDNDGILNCDESLGNVKIDLSNLTSPRLELIRSGSIPPTTASGLFQSDLTNNTFNGNSAGEFTSTLKTSSSSFNSYTINFDKTVNFKLSSSVNLSNIDDLFILKIGPNTKNITVRDPDDQLLIDRDFNGDYETGVTEFSAYEIRFKVNPSALGNTPTFEIIANNVERFTFQHYRPNGFSSDSSFNGKIELTCFSRDSDGDGIEDALDFDSDNDGIPDLYENATKDITLLKVDSNNDGLDDVFGTGNTITDTDNDTIPNYLDLDSDNDGIYDVIESGFTVSSTNGVIDGINSTTVGANGLLNSLEDPLDSGILKTLPRNSDVNSDDVRLRDVYFDFADLDSDGDACFDVLEAGFSGSLSNGMLLPDPNDINGFGIVQNSNGYSNPNPDYLVSSPIIITSFTDKTFCEDETNELTIDSNLDPTVVGDTWQWEVSADGGTTWADVTDNLPYSGSTTNKLKITETPATFDGYKYRVKLGRSGRSCDPIISPEITLKVNGKPKVTNTSIGQCISPNNTSPTVNLTTAQNDINPRTDVTFKFYTDNLASNEITTPNSYPVQPDVPQSVWVTVTDNVTSCVSDIVELVLNVATETQYNIINTSNIQTAFSDDSVDPSTGNIDIGKGWDIDKTTYFTLDKTAIESGIPVIPNNTKIFYFENESDRDNNISSIDITGFRNTITKNDVTVFDGYIQFPVYYKILSTVNNKCEGLGEFYVQIKDTPSVNTVTDIEECDDAASGNTTDGRNSNINLTEKKTYMGIPDPNIFKVTFHKTQSDAFDGINEIGTPENYTNDTQPGFTQGTTSEQTIYVRVENTATGTFNSNTSFKIIIQPIPILGATVVDLEVCDVVTSTDSDSRNRVMQNIDLTVKDSEILAGTAGYEVEYYFSKFDADNRNPISNPKNFQNSPTNTSDPNFDFLTDDPGIQPIFFRIIDNSGIQCPSIVYTFDLKVFPEPNIPITLPALELCDDDLDGDDTNGLVQNIDLKAQRDVILQLYSNSSRSNYELSFFDSENNPIPADSYANSNRDETIIFEVKNKTTGCIKNGSFQLRINKLPSFSITSPQVLCLNNLPYNIEVESPRELYDYQWLDPDGNPIPGSNSNNIDINIAGTYTVTATKTDGTNCSRTRTITINESNIATLERSFVTIVDDSNNLGASNTLSVSIDTINNNLGPGDYQFALLNTETNNRIPFAGYQDEPLFEGIEGGIYQIIVNDRNGCAPDKTLPVSVLQFPKFFTPNGDNENDTWVVKGANRTFYPNSSINIFNRYGKLVGQIQVDGSGWDGTYGGTNLPSDDYWYNVTLVPSDPTKPTINKRGNFSLIRN